MIPTQEWKQLSDNSNCFKKQTLTNLWSEKTQSWQSFEELTVLWQIGILKYRKGLHRCKTKQIKTKSITMTSTHTVLDLPQPFLQRDPNNSDGHLQKMIPGSQRLLHLKNLTRLTLRNIVDWQIDFHSIFLCRINWKLSHLFFHHSKDF